MNRPFAISLTHARTRFAVCVFFPYGAPSGQRALWAACEDVPESKTVGASVDYDAHRRHQVSAVIDSVSADKT